uniref:Uncharacterized protein n=1 Tax=Arundo donax TaxID=35708 RepID=A0A0A9D9P7_ARUDO
MKQFITYERSIIHNKKSCNHICTADVTSFVFTFNNLLTIPHDHDTRRFRTHSAFITNLADTAAPFAATFRTWRLLYNPANVIPHVAKI